MALTRFSYWVCANVANALSGEVPLRNQAEKLETAHFFADNDLLIFLKKDVIFLHSTRITDIIRIREIAAFR